jgi:hypothetical protein
LTPDGRDGTPGVDPDSGAEGPRRLPLSGAEEPRRPPLNGAAGPRRPRSPDHRPLWLVVLSSLTLIYGGVLLVLSLDALREPQAAPHFHASRAMTPAEEEIARRLVDVGVRVANAHARAIRGNAAASVPVALLMLLAAAATMSRDRRGRQVALAAGWTGIVYQIGTLPLALPVVRDYAAQAAPLFAQLAALQSDGRRPVATPEVLAKLVTSSAVFASAVAIGGSLVIIAYFGGRRGRVLYGLERRGP